MNALAKRSDPSQATKVHLELGYAYQLQNRFDEAIDSYRRAGAEDRAAQARNAREIHLANLEAEERRQEEAELLEKLKELEKEARQAADGTL